MSSTTFDANALAADLFQQIRIEPSDPSLVPSNKKNRVSDELVYLSLFLTDLGVYLVFGESMERKQTMDAFWEIIRNSGLNSDALNQRLQAYSEAAKMDSIEASINKLGETFAWHCLALGDPDLIAVGMHETESILQQITAVAASVKS